MNASYDLHLHTCWSYDALATAEDYFRRAVELQVRCIAITEHHVMDSIGDVLELAARHPQVRAVPAAELSVTTSIGAVDLLCYGIPPEGHPALRNVLDAYHEWQRAYGTALSAGMQELGYDFTDEHRLELLRSYRPESVIRLQGNTHVRNGVLADYFVKRGFLARREEYSGFRNRLSQACRLPAYPRVHDVVSAVHASGGLIAIAHPVGYFGGTERQRMDALVAECELDGIECAHPTIPADVTPVYRKYCVERGLFSVGGSDCHTPEDVQHHFAEHIGEDPWLDEFLDRLPGG